ncbi:unnamed protein product, partial [Urochloa humidicola]
HLPAAAVPSPTPSPRTPNPSLRAAALHAAPLSLPADPPHRRPPPCPIEPQSSPSPTPPPPPTQSRSKTPCPCRSCCCRRPQRLPHLRHLRQEGQAQTRCGGATGQQHHDKLVSTVAAVPSWDAAAAGRGVRRRPPKPPLDPAAALPYLVAWPRGGRGGGRMQAQASTTCEAGGSWTEPGLR